MVMTDDQKAGFLTALTYIGDYVVKTHHHAKTKRQEAQNDEERHIHDGVMVACEILGKILVNTAKEITGEDFEKTEDTPPKTE